MIRKLLDRIRFRRIHANENKTFEEFRADFDRQQGELQRTFDALSELLASNPLLSATSLRLASLSVGDNRIAHPLGRPVTNIIVTASSADVNDLTLSSANNADAARSVLLNWAGAAGESATVLVF